MKFIDIITIALKNLWKRKLRTTLTLFAIIIGGLLISIVFSLVSGIENFFALQFETFSDPTFIELQAEKFDFSSILSMTGIGSTEPTEVTSDTPSMMNFMPKSFKNEDITKVKSVEHVSTVSEFINLSVDSIKLDGMDKRYQILLYPYPKFMQEKINLVAGRYVEDNETGKVIVASQYTSVFGKSADELIGQKVYIQATQSLGGISGGCKFTDQSQKPESKQFELEIVGVSEKTIISTLGMTSESEAKEIENYVRCSDNVGTDEDKSRFLAYVKVDDSKNVPDVEKTLEGYGYDARTYSEQKNQMGQLFDILKYFLSAFGIIAMIVASLSIINTLFMAIYERTREIGISKAVGASSFNVLLMFTVEAALLGLIGGVLGTFFGYGLAVIANFIFHGGISFLPSGIAFLKPYETLNIAVLSSDMLIIPTLSTIIAVIAGIIPAWRASRLDPVEALRYE